ncbi:MAG: LLM class F420-dependent oxidoreductase [Sporichthyaceae bacterium]
MTIELGRYGIWMFWRAVTPEIAREIEALGFGAVWLGGSPPGDLAHSESLLEATERLAVATGIVNMWGVAAEEAAESYHRIEKAHPARFLLGVGIGHPEHTADYRSPYDTIVDYLDRLDASGVPKEGMALAALGPKVLKLSAERTAGAHPYLTTPEHTREARALIGPDALLAPELKVVLNTDPEAARAIGRPIVQTPYLGLVNYRSNWLRTGWTEADLEGGGSDAFIDAVVAHGTPAQAAAALDAHLEAGANHVCAQVLVPAGADPLPDIRALAGALRLS